MLPASLAANESASAQHFESEFTEFSEEDRDFDAPEVLDYYFYSRTGLDARVFDLPVSDPYITELPEGHTYAPDDSALRGRTVLDAGCGPGRLIPVAASAADYLVGLDLGDHIDRARRRTSALGNVDLVQGSVLAPPFLQESFEVIYSIGVLHHTPDPKESCLQLARLVRRGGAFALWVYPPSYWGGAIRGVVTRRFHRWFSKLSPFRKLRIAERVLYPLGRLQGSLAKRVWLKFLAAPLFLLPIPRHPRREVMLPTILDYYGPPFISTHTSEEIGAWMREAGLDTVDTLPVPSSCIARKR